MNSKKINNLLITGCTIILIVLNQFKSYAQTQSVSFSTAGTAQTFTVPSGVTSITVKAWGAAGGAYVENYSYINYGGGGGFAQATLSVTPGEVLTIDIGGGGGGTGGAGLNGGGTGGGGGGGMTDIKRGSTFLLIAGGGGGSGNGVGGGGGGLNGGAATGCNVPTEGASQTGGGIQESCGSGATNGSQYQGGHGDQGGGGGGYYGGGGGACGCGGGGGSGYVISSATNTSLIAAPVDNNYPGYNQRFAANNTDSYYNGTAGQGQDQATGSDGQVVIIYGGPKLNGNANPCAGSTVTYTTDAGMSNYVWTVTGGTITAGGGSSDASVTVHWSSTPGSVSVSYSGGGGSGGGTPCSFSIPSNTDIYSAPTTSIVCYSQANSWICAGDTLALTGGCGGANYPTPQLGIFFMEAGSTFNHSGGGGSYTIYLKAHAHYIGGGGGSNVIYADSTAVVDDVSIGDITRCAVSFDYTNAPAGGCQGGNSAGGVTTTLNITPATASAPLVAIAANPSGSVCPGTNVTFTATPTNGGTTPAYQWKKNGSVVGNSSDTYSDNSFSNNDVITCTLTSDAACASPDTATSNTLYVIITASPVAGTITSSEDSVCYGTATSLQVSGNSGNIQWQLSNDGTSYSDISGATSSTFNTGALNQLTFYRVKTTSTCGTDSSTAIQITVLPFPVPGSIQSAKDSICDGAIAHLTLFGNSTNTFIWQSSSGNGFSTVPGATSTSLITSQLTQDTYFRIIASQGICIDTSATLHLIIVPLPAAQFTDTITNLNVNFNSSGSTGATSYLWNFGDSTAVSTSPNAAHQYAKTGTYKVCLTATNNSNCSFTLCQNITVTTTGINAVSPLNWMIYPNPVSDELIIKGNTPGAIISGLALYDLTGRTMVQKEMAEHPTNEYNLDFSALSPGIYFLELRSGVDKSQVKIVKQ